MRNTSVIFTLILLLCSACTKEKTSGGGSRGSISCTVNGNGWTAGTGLISSTRYGDDIFPASGYILDTDDSTMMIFAMRPGQPDTSVITIELKLKKGISGTYRISYEEESEAVAWFFPDLNAYEEYDTYPYGESSGTGTLVLDYDPLSNRLDGTFDFDMKPNPLYPSFPSYKVINGRFSGFRNYNFY